MTDAEIAEIVARAEKATPGPWRATTAADMRIRVKAAVVRARAALEEPTND